jgi:hypothetical protein
MSLRSLTAEGERPGSDTIGGWRMVKVKERDKDAKCYNKDTWST